ncbi:hypothetical protein E3T46_03455 [Cryobacterium sp. Hh11]|uniref:hypothetical protein n=1 Tax=Cryobacterium sp. Hh11 TaxID=2555868 RepID=UPI001069BAE4|nr:hypothetical protein [Cryobacterium sp. Hh11]TFD53384.1 hypothetical protein E3T46_03455 [Cryobacterium sp. Hh11]
MTSTDASTTELRTHRFSVADWLICLGLVMASLVVGLVHVPQHQQISPIDEFVYIDYLAKVSTEGVVERGEETGDYAREYFACHGVSMYTEPQPALCFGPNFAEDSQYPFGGVTSADLYTPLYFGTTWLMVQPIQWAGVQDLAQAGRYAGSIWLAFALVFMFAALRRIGISRWVGLGLGLLLAGSLPAYWSHTFVSTDATALPAGAVMLYLAIVFMQTRRFGWLLISASAIVTLFKLQNLTAVAAVALGLVVYAGVEWFGRSDLRVKERILRAVKDRRTVVAVSAVVAGIFVQAVWTVIRSVIAVGPAPDQLVSEPIGFRALISEMFKFFPNAVNGATAPQSLGVNGVIVASLFAIIAVAGVLGLIASGDRRSWGFSLAVGTLVVSLVAGPALAVANLATSGFYFSLPSRYGLALVPMFVCCAALLFSQKRWLTNSVAISGGAAFLVSLAITGAA